MNPEFNEIGTEQRPFIWFKMSAEVKTNLTKKSNTETIPNSHNTILRTNCPHLIIRNNNTCCRRVFIKSSSLLFLLSLRQISLLSRLHPNSDLPFSEIYYAKGRLQKNKRYYVGIFPILGGGVWPIPTCWCLFYQFFFGMPKSSWGAKKHILLF